MSAQPPNARNCMNSRSFGALRLAVLVAALLAEVRRLGSASRCRVGSAMPLSIIRATVSADYRVRAATLADADVLVRHRIAHVHRHGRAARRRASSIARFAPGSRTMMPAGHVPRVARRDRRRRGGRRRRDHHHSVAAWSALCRRPPRVRLQRLHRAGAPAARARAADHGHHPRAGAGTRGSPRWR